MSTLCDSMNSSLPGFSVPGILQARILEWVAMPSFSGSFQPRIEPAYLRFLHWQTGSLPHQLHLESPFVFIYVIILKGIWRPKWETSATKLVYTGLRKVITNLDSILKSRDITLPTKVHLVKAMVFLVVMYGYESWTVKKAERQRIDAFELWCCRRLLRVPWTARRSNQSILKEISPGISLEGMMLKLKVQYFGHLMRRVDSLEKTLMLGGNGGRRRRGRQRMRWLDGITDSMDVSLSELRELVVDGRPGVMWFMASQRVGHDWATELNWTEKNKRFKR